MPVDRLQDTKQDLWLAGLLRRRVWTTHETFAPTVRVIHIRTLLAVAACNDWEVEQLDVVAAFLEADIEEKIYMR
jgi:hypothetical protein